MPHPSKSQALPPSRKILKSSVNAAPYASKKPFLKKGGHGAFNVGTWRDDLEAFLETSDPNYDEDEHDTAASTIFEASEDPILPTIPEGVASSWA